MTRREPESTRSAEAGSDIESVAEETNDAELVHRTLAGDHRAFTLLYRRHAPLLFRRLRRVLFQRQDVHDVLQQTFLEMYRNLSRYRADKSFSAWLLGFSFKITGHYLRAHKRHQRLQLVPAASLEERNVDGFSVHANVAVRASERKRLEKVARYIARPPIATERLEELEDGRIQYRLRRPWSKVSFGVATSFSEGRSRCVSKVILMSSCQKADHSAATFAKAHRESYSECGSSVGRPIWFPLEDSDLYQSRRRLLCQDCFVQFIREVEHHWHRATIRGCVWVIRDSQKFPPPRYTKTKWARYVARMMWRERKVG